MLDILSCSIVHPTSIERDRERERRREGETDQGRCDPTRRVQHPRDGKDEENQGTIEGLFGIRSSDPLAEGASLFLSSSSF